MKLKYTLLILTPILLFIGFSCNDDNNNNYVDSTLSADAQIYNFAITGKALNKIDSTNYPIMAKTKFVIDQAGLRVYNPDSLPYRTRLAKFATTIGLAQASPSKVTLIYSDTTKSWNSTDSIDYTKLSKIKVTAQDGTTERTYKVDLLVHKVDPDSITWTAMTTLPRNLGQSKTILKDGNFFFYTQNNSSLLLYKASQNNLVWSQASLSGLPVGVKLVSITVFGNFAFATDGSGQSYISADGITWNQTAKNVTSILGVLPGQNADSDYLLVVTLENGKHVFAKTKDMVTLDVIKHINGSATYLIEDAYPNFPYTGYSVVTNYSRTDQSTNLLVITGGQNLNGQTYNATWLLRNGNSGFEITSQPVVNSKFLNVSSIPTFLYDGMLHAYVQDSIYSSLWGTNWQKVVNQQQPLRGMQSVKDQTIISDNNNYVWIFGGVSSQPSLAVWRGRMNKLNK